MPLRRNEVDRFESFRTKGYDDFNGVYQGSDSVLRSWKMNSQFYETGLQILDVPRHLTADHRRLKDALDLIMSQLKADEEPGSWSMDNQDGSLSGEFFAPLESLVVLQILLRGVSQWRRVLLDQNSVPSELMKEISNSEDAVRELLYEKKTSVLFAYKEAVGSYQQDEAGLSVLSVVWHGWRYPQGLPEGHPVFVSIDQFRKLFIKDEAA
jgi:hypothetical protein